MKLAKKFKKYIVFLLVITMTLSIFGVVTSFAEMGDKVKVSIDSVYDSNGKKIRYNSATKINGETVGGVGEENARIFVNSAKGKPRSGIPAFCIEPSALIRDGDKVTEGESGIWAKFSNEKKKAINLAILYGYYMNWEKILGVNGDEKNVATQTLVWELAVDYRNTSGDYQRTNRAIYDVSFGKNYPNRGAESVYQAAAKMLEKHNTVPSFMLSGKAFELKFDKSKGENTVTLEDTNKVLSEYDFSCSDPNVRFSEENNKLTISSNVNIKGNIKITAKRNNIPSVSASCAIVDYGDGKGGKQDIITGVSNSNPVISNAEVKIADGDLEIIKTAEDNQVEGIEFTVNGEDFTQVVVTDRNGKATIQGLVPGIYTVTEKLYDKYEQQVAKEIEVKAGDVASVSFDNVIKRGGLEITKTSEDNQVEGIEFTITEDNVAQTVFTDRNGKAIIQGLLPGIYKVTEKSYDKYEQQSAKEVEVKAGDTASISFNNVVRRGDLEVTKTSEDNQIEGIEFTVNGEGFTQPIFTDKNGKATIQGLLPGVYTVTEKSYDKYEQQAAKEVEVKAGDTASISFNNVVRRGDLEVTKTSEDNQIEGIEFTVNGEGFTQTIFTDKNGKATIQGLLPGIYKVTEKSYDKYEQQAAREVEVKAGDTSSISFNNVVRRGDLEVTKTSEDNQIEGIEFTVNGEGFTQPIFTDKNGKATIQGLLPGVYTVTEKSYDKYEQQAAKEVEVKAGDTASISFNNVVRRGDLEVTKTSEDNQIEGIEFTVNGEGFTQTIFTDKNGKATIQGLLPGVYTVTEKSYDKYEQQAAKELEVKAGDTSFILFNNVVRRGDLEVTKTSEDNQIEGIEFTVNGEGFTQTIFTDKNGKATIQGLLPGVYTVTEKSYDKYEQQSAKEVEVKSGDVVYVKFNNTLIYGTINGKKTDENGNGLNGALIGIFEDNTTEFTERNAFLTAVSADDGSFRFDKVPYGTWIICELKSPDGFKLLKDRKTININKMGEVIGIEIVNSKDSENGKIIIYSNVDNNFNIINKSGNTYNTENNVVNSGDASYVIPNDRSNAGYKSIFGGSIFTGDNNIIFWVSLSVILSLGIVIIVVIKIKKG